MGFFYKFFSTSVTFRLPRIVVLFSRDVVPLFFFVATLQRSRQLKRDSGQRLTVIGITNFHTFRIFGRQRASGKPIITQCVP